MKAGIRLAAAVATLAVSPVALAQHTNVAEAGGPYTWVQGSGITLTNTGHSSDVLAQPGWDLDLDGTLDFTTATVHLDAAQASVFFGNVGAYTVAARITDSLGSFSIDTAIVQATSPSAHQHVVGAGGPYSMVLGSPLTLAADPFSFSTDPASTFSWDLNRDGAADFLGFTVGLDSAQAASFFASAGTYRVEFRATDSLGGFTVDRTTLNVLAVPVPEPYSYALLVAGLGLLGFAARRKKQGRTPITV